MLIYLDNCTFNRPFDDQTQIRIKIETEAKLFIQHAIRDGRTGLIWSYINESENLRNPFAESKTSIARWKQLATVIVFETENLLRNAANLVELGLKPKDALHLASAVEGKADFFLTTDDAILRKLTEFRRVVVVNPIDLIDKIAYDY